MRNELSLSGPGASLREALPATYRLALGALVFTAFLTQAKFVPSIRNNIGPFEILGLLLIGAFLLSSRTWRPLAFNASTRVAFGILAIAVVSQLNIPDHRRGAGLVHIAIQIFFALFLLVIFNLMRQYRVSPRSLLRWVGIALLIVGPWIIVAGMSGPSSVQEVGPFRNRAHMASYMLTAFWIVLVYSQWPELKLRERLIAYSGVAMTLYAIAVAGRRSVYLSLLIGLLGIGIGFLIATRQKRWRLVVVGVFTFALIYFMYAYGPRYLPQLAFFQTRVQMIDDRLEEALAVSEKDAVEKGFLELQREGVRHAFSTHPFIGIGWGGFAKSHYSPTGHEVHSTPMRFVAETGMIGLGLYLAFMGLLLRSVWLGFLSMRRTPYGNAYLVLATGLSSLLVSYAYNRHVTERTFWLLTAVIFGAELFARRYRAAMAALRPDPAAASGPGQEKPTREARREPPPRLRSQSPDPWLPSAP